ncbi:hypothetical protein I4U23_016451 [Adineta vaga]|nr:hypothetical protein I4U23_016451 [Adineta vaga]
MTDKKALVDKLISLSKTSEDLYRSFYDEYLIGKNERNLEPYTLVWYDADMNDTNDTQQIQYELHRLINFIKIFNDPDKCQTYIEEIKTEKIIIIMSNNHDHQLLRHFHDQIRVIAIYIYSRDNYKASGSDKQFPKVKAVVTDSTELIKTIETDQRKRAKLEDSIGTIGSFFNPNERSTKNLANENGDFIWFQLFIETLLRMSNTALHSSRKEFIELVRQQYHDDVAKLRIVDELQSTYQTDQAVWWYTRDSFLYVILNKALRQQDFVLLFTLRFFLHDLFQTLREQKRFNGIVVNLYRGQVLDIDELNDIINNQGKFFSMNSLLSTSRNRSIAHLFAESAIDPDNHRHRAVLFELEADTNRVDTKPFADVTDISYFRDGEDEVLFMAGSIFRIIDVQKGSEDDPVWTVKLVLCGEEDNQLNEVFTTLKAKLDDETDMSSVGKVLDDMGKRKEASRAYDLGNEHMRSESNGRFGNSTVSSYTKGEYYPTIIEELQKGVVRLTETNGDRNDLAFYYQIIGGSYKELQQYDRALENYSKALNVHRDLHSENHLKVAIDHECIGQTYEKQENYQLAILSWKECLRIRQQLLPQMHPTIADTFFNIGDVYNDVDDLDSALEMYEQALQIQLISLPSNHPSIATTYQRIGDIYEQMKEFHLALKNYTIAFNILQASRPLNHPSLVNAQEDIDNMKKALITCSDK